MLEEFDTKTFKSSPNQESGHTAEEVENEILTEWNDWREVFKAEHAKERKKQKKKNWNNFLQIFKDTKKTKSVSGVGRGKVNFFFDGFAI